MTLLLWVAIVIAGAYAYSSLKYTLLPDLSIPLIVVDVKLRGTHTAVQTERLATAPLEARLSAAGAKTIRSTTKPGTVSISLAFEVGNTLDQRRHRVDALLAAHPLPAGVTTKVTSVDINEDAVTTYAVTAKDHQALLLDAQSLAASAVPAFGAVSGVLRAELIGADPSTTARYNGEPALMLRVVKKGGANALDVAADAAIVAGRVRDILHIPLVEATSQAPYIREASHATTEALGIAMALAVLVVFPFLRDVRATLISAVAIPVSLAGTALVMAYYHFNLETITLLALTLVTGVIVDDAIVDVENIVRHIENGESPREASVHATDEIGLTVSAATLTIVAVFLPIGFMNGTLGQFFRPFSITASAAVITSLLVARTLSPMLAAYTLRPHRGAKRDERPVPGFYRAALQWSLRHRALVLVGALLSFGIGLAIIPFIPKGFIPHLDRGAFDVYVSLKTAGKHPLLDVTRDAERVSAAIARDPAVATVLAAAGDRGDPTLASIYVTLRRDRDRTTVQVEDRVRATLPTIAAATTSVEDIPFVSNGVAKPLRVTLSDQTLATLAHAGSLMVAALARIPGFVDVTSSGLTMEHGQAIRIDREDRHRIVDIDADLEHITVGDATQRVEPLARRMLPPTTTYTFGGMSGDTITTFGSFAITLVLSTLSIFVVLGILFRGWRAPLVIVLALPLCIVGAFFALFVVRAEFGLISLMGVIFLFGLVNKNAILLVDAIRQRRRAGMEQTAAVMEAASRRFRPIVMTTAATILGMLPIAIGFGAGSELRSPMAVAIIGGLLSSTVLSLIVVPVAYTLVERRAA